MKGLTILAAGAAVLALVAAGCGGGDAEAKAASAQQTREDAMLAFARCMRENGIDMPDPQTGGGGGVLMRVEKGNREEFEQANEACRHHMKDAMGTISEEDRQRMQDQALKFARCMREHGIDMPDPTFDGSGKIRQALRASPGPKQKMREAEEACRDEGGPVFSFGGNEQ